MAKSTDFTLHLTAEEYAKFRAHPATRLYLHRYRASDGRLMITSSKPRQLAKDLEQAIDFGATSAAEVLNLHMLGINSL